MSEYTLSAETLGGDVPALRLASAGAAADAPLVIVLHPLGSRKEKMLPGLLAFAGAGFQAVAIDAALHGERPDAAEREARLQADFLGASAAMIEGTARDVSRVLDALGAERAGIHGISLGGYTVFAALLTEPRLVAASSAIGSPDWAGPLRAYGLGPGNPLYDRAAATSPLTLLPSVLPPRPLLMQHGNLDETVPADGVLALEERLRPLYAQAPERLHLELYPGLGHTYPDDMERRAVEWMTRFAQNQEAVGGSAGAWSAGV
jgi:dienelactone hydrolase